MRAGEPAICRLAGVISAIAFKGDSIPGTIYSKIYDQQTALMGATKPLETESSL